MIERGGVLYIADTGNHAVRMINNHGIISTIVGGKGAGASGEGMSACAAHSASLPPIALQHWARVRRG